MNDRQSPSLGEAATGYLANLSLEAKGAGQQGIYKFARWCGWGRPLAGLTASEVASYAEQLSPSTTGYLNKIALIRSFLVYARKEGWTETNLAVHLKAGRGKTRLSPSSKRDLPGKLSLTQQGYAELEAELATLKSKRLQTIEEVRLAAADKDFRENAPLAAAREQQGYLEGRIRELEEAQKSAVVIDENQKEMLEISIGDSVLLCDLDSGEELCYIIVSPREVDPAGGKISSASPIGKAVIGRQRGEVVEVVTPAGKLRYQIKQD